MEEHPPLNSASVPQMRFGKIDDLASRVAVAVDAARKVLFSQQHEEGYWCGELEADTTLESDYILLHALLGTGSPERSGKVARHILQHQNEDGGWSILRGGPSNISVSVKAYFGLKLAGFKAGPSCFGPCSEQDSGTGWSDRGQHLHQDLSLFFRSVRL